MRFLLFVLFLTAANAEYYSYTRANLDVPIEVTERDVSNSLMNSANPTKFIVHGFNGNENEQWIISMKNQFLVDGDYNVVVLKWLGIETAVEAAGRGLSNFYDNRFSEGYLLSNFHCLGLGVGAHVCGYSGKLATAATLGRITGLDPASRGFTYEDPTTRLNSTDAEIVDVIHTDSGDGQTSFMQQIGSVDFYPNGGSEQVGCEIDPLDTCSHHRSYIYYTESLTSASPGFFGYDCPSYDLYNAGNCSSNQVGRMGEHLDVTLGTYYLITNREALFATGSPDP